MSIEAQILVKASFSSEASAKDSTSELKESLKRNNYELASALDSLNTIENQGAYKDATINVEEITRNKAVVSIYAYTYTSEEPTWFAKSLYELGANKIYIRGVWDGHIRNYYFLEGKRVPKNAYNGDKPKKPLSAKDIEINKNLFLPEGRVHVKARLVNYWDVGDIYESVLMEFATEDGISFYHKATGQLKQMSYEGSPTVCEFSAVFERGKHQGKYASFAKRPTKITIGNTMPHSKSPALSIPKFIPKPRFHTEAKCPFCGSSLRTEKAKQCPTCLKSWRDE